jgi:hypothetical protein
MTTNAGTFVAALSRELVGKTPALSTQRKARYGKEFKEQLEGGVAAEVLERAVARIAERWEEHQLTVEMAVRDVSKRISAPAEELGWNPHKEGLGTFLERTLTRQERGERRRSQMREVGWLGNGGPDDE